MEKTPFLGAENELQKIYSNLGVMIPVGDLSQGKAPAIQPLPTEVTNDTITFNFNVMSNAEITEISYSTDHMDEGTITPKKGKISISFDRNPNDTSYEIGITVTNENGSTSVDQLAEFPIIPNWATPDEVLLGNKYIGEDGQEHTGEYECPTCPEPVLETVSVTPTTSAQTITPSTGYDGIETVNVSAVTSAIDANITAGNIKNGVTILGVTGTMPASPTDGGAVIDACEYIEHIQGSLDGPSGIRVTFSSSLPTEEGHTYYTQLFIETYSYDISEPDYIYVPVFFLDIWNVELNYIQDGAEINSFGYSLVDSEGNPLQESPAKLYVYEDNYLQDPKWIVPCTYTNTTVQQ